GASLTCVPPSGSTFAKGLTTVACTNTDASGNSAHCSFTITVNDNEPPSVVCPANIVTNLPAGQCSDQIVSFDVSATDNCPGVTVSCTPTNGSVFPKGTNVVTCTATDAVGNTTNCNFSVIVRDTEAPLVTCPANIMTNAAAGQCSQLVSFEVTVTDNCPGATVSCAPASGSAFPGGVNTVTCTAIDASGNTNACTFTVTVNDLEPPIITCPANIVTNSAPEETSQIVTYAPSASDNCPGTQVSCTPPSGSSFSLGTVTVNCVATDTAGNTDACNFTVTVQQVLIANPDTLGALANHSATVLAEKLLENDTAAGG